MGKYIKEEVKRKVGSRASLYDGKTPLRSESTHSSRPTKIVEPVRKQDIVDEVLRQFSRRINYYGGGTASGPYVPVNDVNGSSLVGFIQSGAGAVAGTMQGQLRKFGFLSDFDTTANFNTFRAALTGTLGITPTIQFANIDATATTPGVLKYGGATFNGTYDPVLYFGYNLDGQSASSRVNTSEPSLKIGLEGNYNNGSANFMELNLDYVSSDGLTSRRGLAYNINRSTHNQAWGWSGLTHQFWKTDIGSGPHFDIDVTNLTSTEVIAIRIAGGSNELFQLGPTTAGVLTSFGFGFGAASGSGGWVDTTSTQVHLRVGATAIGTLTSSGLSVPVGLVAISGVATPQITFAPSSGATKNSQIYQTGNSLVFADQGVANRLVMDLGTGNLGIAGAAVSASSALVTPAGSTSISSLRVPHGSAPTSPVDGDVWTTTAGLFVRVNGVTVGPLS